MKRLFIPYVLALLIAGNNPVAGQNSMKHIRFGSTGDPLNGLTVTWQGEGTSDSIAWGYASAFEKGKAKGGKRVNVFGKTVYDFTFPSLLADTTVHYALFDSKGGVWTGEKTYKTASDASDNTFSFTALGDSRTNPDEWKKISEATLETDFTLFIGDIIADGAIEAGWDDWFEYGEKFITRELIYHCIGNHDEDNSATGFDTYIDMFTLPDNEMYYSFTYGNALFICLNTEASSNASQQSWLNSTLYDHKDKTWKFVFFHRPFYTSPSHIGEMDPYFNTIWKMFDDYGVDMIFNGHTHNYQRTKPINRNISTVSPVAAYGSLEGTGRCQVVAGSAGAPMSAAASSSLWWLERSKSLRHFCNVEIDGDELTFKAMDVNQAVFDELVLNKQTQGDAGFNVAGIYIYPNPSRGEFYLSMPPGERFSYRIFNSAGQVVAEMQNVRTDSDPFGVNLSQQPRGIYFIELTTAKGRHVEKIILQ